MQLTFRTLIYDLRVLSDLSAEMKINPQNVFTTPLLFRRSQETGRFSFALARFTPTLTRGKACLQAGRKPLESWQRRCFHFGRLHAQ